MRNLNCDVGDVTPSGRVAMLLRCGACPSSFLPSLHSLLRIPFLVLLVVPLGITNPHPPRHHLHLQVRTAEHIEPLLEAARPGLYGRLIHPLSLVTLHP